jgi:hypothetical protein
MVLKSPDIKWRLSLNGILYIYVDKNAQNKNSDGDILSSVRAHEKQIMISEKSVITRGNYVDRQDIIDFLESGK